MGTRELFSAHGRWAGAAVAMVAVLVCAGAASAADDPTVEFVGSSPLRYDLARLRTDGGLTVEVNNTTGVNQRATVRVAEFGAQAAKPDAAAAALFPSTGVEVTLDGSESQSVKIPLEGAKDPAEGEHSGTVVIDSAAAPVSRRELIVSVSGKKADVPKGAALDPSSLSDLTLTATNFLPSPLSPVGPTLLVLAVLLVVAIRIGWGWLVRLHAAWRVAGLAGVVGLVVAAIALQTFGDPTFGPALVAATLGVAGVVASQWDWLGGNGGRRALRVVLILAAAGLAAGTVLLGEFGSRLDDQPGLRHIQSKSLLTTGGVVDGRVGVVTMGEGDVAEIRVDDRRLSPTDLDRAGTYSGVVDVNGSGEKGDAKTTVNVRDWWLWAVAVITIGILTGYKVRRWFEGQRPREQLRRRMERLWTELAPSPAGPRPREGWTPVERTGGRLRDIERRLKTDDTTTKADEELEALEKYVADVAALGGRLDELESASAALAARWQREPFGVERGEVRALTLADDLLRTTFDSGEPDTGRERYDDAKTDIDAASDLIKPVTEVHSLIVGYRRRIGDWIVAYPKQGTTLREAAESLRKLGGAVFRAGSAEEVKVSRESAVTTFSALPKLVDDELAAGGLSEEVVEELEELRRAGVEALDAEAPVGARIDAKMLSPVVAGSLKGNLDDRFVFRAVVEQGSGETVELEWAFGDEADRVKQTVPTSGETPWIERSFATKGTHEVRLLVPGGSELDRVTVEVEGPSRAASGIREFREQDLAWTLVAGALTIGAGVLGLYLSDPAWGTDEDYVKAGLWGSVVSEGVGYVVALVGRTFGK